MLNIVKSYAIMGFIQGEELPKSKRRGDGLKRINFPLWIGCSLVLLLLACSFFPEWFTSKDPNYQQIIRNYSVMENGVEVHKMQAAPWGSNSDNIMGTDEIGRDIYTRLIYGTKITLTVACLTVALRFLLAIPLGVLGGVGVRPISWLIKLFNTVFTAIPTLFAAFFILNIDYIANLQMDRSIKVFATVLAVLGWAKLASQVEERTKRIMGEDFIEGEIAVGKSKLQIIFQNLMPHLIPSLVSFIFLEVGLVIFLMAQLSIFGVFVGTKQPFLGFESGVRWYLSRDPEWASMMSRAAENNRLGHFWMSLYPALAFGVGILAFNLTGEGLRIEFEKSTSRVASMIRKLGFVLSPRIYFQQLKKYKEYPVPVAVKTLVIVGIVVALLIPSPASLYPFQSQAAMAHVEELTKPEYGGRLSGHEGGYLAGEYIVSKLKEYGYLPYDGENYYQTIEDANNWSSPQVVLVEEADLELVAPSGETYHYSLDTDFYIVSMNTKAMKSLPEGDFLLEGVVGKGLEEEPADWRKGRIPIGYETLTSNGQLYARVYQWREGIHAGFLSIPDEEHFIPFYTMHHEQNYLVPKGALKEQLAKGSYQVNLLVKAPVFPQAGRNIIGVLPGKDWYQPNDSNHKKEVLMFGAPYDGIGIREGMVSAIRTTSAAINLEIARVLSQLEEPLEKTLIFVFWDGESTSNSGTYYYNNYNRIFNHQYHDIFYFDVGYAPPGEKLNLAFEKSLLAQLDTYSMENSIHDRLQERDYQYFFGQINSSTYQNIGYNLTLKLGIEGADLRLMDSVEDTIDVLDPKQMEAIGQFLIDLVTMDEHFK